MGFLRNIFGIRSSDLADFIEAGAVIIDVRTPEEFGSGHVRGSKNIPLSMLISQVEDIRKLNKPVVTVCKSGVRSGTARTFLESQGIKAVNGGSWKDLDAIIQ